MWKYLLLSIKYTDHVSKDVLLKLRVLICYQKECNQVNKFSYVV